MTSTSDIFLKYVIPGFGVIMGNIMFAAPVKDCYMAVKVGKGLGPLNPIPWAFTLGNCFGWLTYAVLKQDVFIFVGNGPGFLMAIWLNMQAVKLQYDSFRLQETRKSILVALEEAREFHSSSEFLINDTGGDNSNNDATNNGGAIVNYFSYIGQIVSKVTAPELIAPALHDKLVLANALVWMIVVSIICFATTFTDRTNELIVGITVNLNLVVFYAAPLSVIWNVVNQRNSISIHVCTMITNTLNGTFWAIYGLAIMDPFIYVTNGLGAGLGVVQIILCMLFPRKKVDDESINFESSKMLAEEPKPATQQSATNG